MAAAESLSPDTSQGAAPHVPVLIDPLIEHAAPVSGHWVDGTFGAGGYARRLLAAGAERLTGIDRDPSAITGAAAMVEAFAPRLEVVPGRFSQMGELVEGPVAGVVLDLGVSSMQLDQAERGFSFMRDGPLDMRMASEGPSAADLVNEADEAHLADIIHFYGEERAARRIAKAIVKARPLSRTLELAEVVSSCLPKPRPGQVHPATRSFQGIRIAVNDEFGELIAGLEAAEGLLAEGGVLAVVTFHSLEDRVVKRYLAARSGAAPRANRFAPEQAAPPAPFEPITKKAVAPTEEETAANPRARSAKLRMARRTGEAGGEVDRAQMGLPGPKHWWKG
ncbi:16S rRNA (cytosine(1402)-N(4))-methyltransferase RsmH [Oceanicola sp. 502str15]|uniref:16S rRNA (cytosine(1402)-N(4))-methyltransferase RsmH n=1 Tax=Oceanicola sp. 502str15 TaxID=2696061 RepID=UPI00209510C5|nr:16S rRNA (cytosine(1402)-N(4))-methyltransferase RsmH [Oceanicola sp. 502str15]MCO6381426.1 16S rRNA (cytosine(1402)-N(4))-methyltransferase RsmH [Oceanicola sp. 502str15]